LTLPNVIIHSPHLRNLKGPNQYLLRRGGARAYTHYSRSCTSIYDTYDSLTYDGCRDTYTPATNS